MQDSEPNGGKGEKYREKWGYEGAMEWQVTRKMFYEVMLQNAEVKELIESFKKNPLAYIATTATAPTTRELFLAAFRDYPGVSPIEIVEERERNLTNTETHSCKVGMIRLQFSVLPDMLVSLNTPIT